jgi:murein L,D-transpeptidase YcbB/YkuD
MRCDKPVDLAKTILDFDTLPRQKRNPVTRDTLDTLLSRAKNHPIPLKYTFPIYVEYITVRASRKSLTFHPDIYLRDEEYLKLLKK